MPNPLKTLAHSVEQTVKNTVKTAGLEAANAGKNVARQAEEAAIKNLGWAAKPLGLSAYAKPGVPPVLQRPVVMIPGFTMKASSYDPMAQHLASNPKNGKVAVYVAADGRFHQGSASGPLMNKAQVGKTRIFEIEYKDPNGPTTEKAPQIQAALRAVASATGAGSVDVVAHSAGCTDFRTTCRTAAPRIRRLAFRTRC